MKLDYPGHRFVCLLLDRFLVFPNANLGFTSSILFKGKENFTQVTLFYFV